jgi:hypothetical protein
MPTNSVIDLSHHNGTRLRFNKAKTDGIVGVIQKATQGEIYVDPTFKKNRTAVGCASSLRKLAASRFTVVDVAVAWCHAPHFESEFARARPQLDRTMMMTRRALVLTGATGLAAAISRAALAKPASPPNDPVAIVNAIYARAAKGRGDGGGAFIIENQVAKAKYLSKSLVELWAKADAHTPKGDVGPVDFDPVTNSQEPNVKSFKLVPEKLDPDKAVIAVIIAGRGAPRAKSVDNTIRYSLVRDDGQWKIDDISGASDGEAWSIREMLGSSLKN